MNAEPIPSEIEIIPKEHYILVKPPAGMNYWELFTALGKLIQMPEFQDKNDIWLFRVGRASLNFSDLQKLKDFGRENIPENAKGKKTAIVVSSGFQRGIVKSYISDGEEHPREIRVFSDLKEAEDWVCE